MDDSSEEMCIPKGSPWRLFKRKLPSCGGFLCKRLIPLRFFSQLKSHHRIFPREFCSGGFSPWRTYLGGFILTENPASEKSSTKVFPSKRLISFNSFSISDVGYRL